MTLLGKYRSERVRVQLSTLRLMTTLAILLLHTQERLCRRQPCLCLHLCLGWYLHLWQLARLRLQLSQLPRMGMGCLPEPHRRSPQPLVMAANKSQTVRAPGCRHRRCRACLTYVRWAHSAWWGRRPNSRLQMRLPAVQAIRRRRKAPPHQQLLQSLKMRAHRCSQPMQSGRARERGSWHELAAGPTSACVCCLGPPCECSTMIRRMRFSRSVQREGLGESRQREHTML